MTATGAPLRVTSTTSPEATRLSTAEKLRAASVAVMRVTARSYQINQIDRSHPPAPRRAPPLDEYEQGAEVAPGRTMCLRTPALDRSASRPVRRAVDKRGSAIATGPVSVAVKAVAVAARDADRSLVGRDVNRSSDRRRCASSTLGVPAGPDICFAQVPPTTRVRSVSER